MELNQFRPVPSVQNASLASDWKQNQVQIESCLVLGSILLDIEKCRKLFFIYLLYIRSLYRCNEIMGPSHKVSEFLIYFFYQIITASKSTIFCIIQSVVQHWQLHTQYSILHLKINYELQVKEYVHDMNIRRTPCVNI